MVSYRRILWWPGAGKQVDGDAWELHLEEPKAVFKGSDSGVMGGRQLTFWMGDIRQVPDL